MSNILIKYMEERFYKSKKLKEPVKKWGPIITISREVGCPAEEISDKIIKFIHQYSKDQWTCISKEILEKSSTELNLHPDKIQYVFKAEKKSMFEEVLSAFLSKYYKSDKKIRKTIAKVISNYAEDGKVVIIGRGGVAIAKNVDDSFHIRLQGPLKWKADIISKQKNITLSEAEDFVKDLDSKRKNLIESFCSQKFEDILFDATFNCAKMTTDEIAGIAFDLLKMRSFCEIR
ncbi:MAG: cytidylate kinase-like family protein [Bacteroidales bacterium]|nr:cytidylate kinase-like family protein [Bacteroidales bacterium]